MPQMSPMPWMLILMLSFSTLMLINSHIFFFTSKNLKINKNSFKIKNFNIKW